MENELEGFDYLNNHTVQKLANLYSTATRIQDQQELMKQYDLRRQKLRESEGMLRKSKIQGENTWICFGSTTFMEFPTSSAEKLLSEDRKVAEEAIRETEKEMKSSMDQLLKMEGQKTLADRGFDLASISQ